MIPIQKYNEIGYDIIGCAYEVRRNASRGLRENYYQSALEWELKKKGYEIGHGVCVPALYKGEEIRDAYEADIVVNNLVIIETKALTTVSETECRQLMTYMKLMTLKLGYLINFGAKDFSFGNTRDPLPYTKGL